MLPVKVVMHLKIAFFLNKTCANHSVQIEKADNLITEISTAIYYRSITTKGASVKSNIFTNYT